MIDYPALMPYVERYASMDMQPLRIELYLRGYAHLAGYDPLNLDNLLARCVVDEATQRQGLPTEFGAYRLPVPLRALWHGRDGLPMWAATPFVALDETRDVFYWHKRAQSGRWTGTHSGKFAIRSTQGRWMKRRVPLPVHLASRWTANCIGNADEIARLLQSLTCVGKRRSIGFGEVERWVICDGAFDLVRDDRLTRTLPYEALDLLRGKTPEGNCSLIGWTPPQWKPGLFSLGWREGTPVYDRNGVISPL
jgi:hypothetical protein